MSHGFRGPHKILTSGGFDKKALRARGLDARSRIEGPAAEAFSRRLARLGPELARAHGAEVTSAFWPIADEIPTELLLHALAASGFAVALPVTGRRGTPLAFRRWAPDASMVRGPMDIPEPRDDAELLEPDLLFVPLAAFDRRGHRIGYGAGFYDATLADLRAKKAIVAIGLAYAAQEVLFVPAEAHDEPLDFVVTEKDTIVCADAG